MIKCGISSTQIKCRTHPFSLLGGIKGGILVQPCGTNLRLWTTQWLCGYGLHGYVVTWLRTIYTVVMDYTVAVEHTATVEHTVTGTHSYCETE